MAGDGVMTFIRTVDPADDRIRNQGRIDGNAPDIMVLVAWRNCPARMIKGGGLFADPVPLKFVFEQEIEVELTEIEVNLTFR